MNKQILLPLLLIVFSGALTSCDYLDVVPDNVATIEDNAFALRADAKRFLYTCYSYMPDQASASNNPGFLASDELVFTPTYDGNSGSQVMQGNQSVVDPYLNYWEGQNGGTDLYEGVRQANIFIENIGSVPDMTETEKAQWAAEAKFLKAYYLFYLTRMYGPIVLPKENISVSESTEGVRVTREPVDEVFSYIVQLLDKAITDLPDEITNQEANLGRITKTIAYGIKAKVLVTAASPLFNGNQDYAGFANKDGEIMFNQEYDPAKWDSALVATQEAIDFAEQMGHSLHYFESSVGNTGISDSTKYKLNVRTSVTEQWNSEIIWANTDNSTYSLQRDAAPRGIEPAYVKDNTNPWGRFGVPFHVVELFYSDNGVPIEEDKTWEYGSRYNFKTITEQDRFYLKPGYITANMNFNREPRFYASLGFDGAIWYGQGHYDDKSNEQLYIQSKKGQPASEQHIGRFSMSGYWPKKLFHYQTVVSRSSFNTKSYPWPVLRLTDLYLLHAEAKNEVDGPGPDVYDYVNRIRERAGLPSVQDAWTKYSVDPNKFKTKEGMRDIIHQERMIELAFEAKRFWDLRRWKEASLVLNQPLSGWSINQVEEKAYYRPRTFFQQKFTARDYLWPISEEALLTNTKLTQNPGW
ncbi:RagB/SusD family nutrient uptake outer membrane protein [Fodinibius salsisoli]|uniref:RagB/SusD family nutrient uptake outer membrane protein n=1 Tax=Fodinibius salsisoli TaxID=2820877 RepID=A0ABT3PJN9_9BACT|nr:RagB/SusD family nutrient uptake outer membrane protein [Fodinibius salsisoli]MCW9705968.1 RagB/SusD family nutrient uptake outer membrane protein [Fodinibius salsisoli]